MGILQTTEQTMMHKVGPLPVWGWAAMAGGAVLIFRVIHKGGAASTALGTASNTLTGAGSGTGTGSTGTGTGTDTTGGTGTASAVPTISPTDLAGGNVLDFVKGLGQNFNSFSFATGGSSVGVSNSAQNILDAQNFQAKLLADAQNQQTAANEATQLAGIQAQQNVSLNTNQLLSYQAYLAHGGSPYFSAPGLVSNYRPSGGGVSALGGANPLPNAR